MNEMDQTHSDEVVRWQEKLFTRSVRRQMRFRKLKELLGSAANQQCLEISAGDGVISSKLRDGGGYWQTRVTTNEARVAVGHFVKEGVAILDNGIIDLPDFSMDAVVIVDVLECIENDHEFIRECHRVLKPDGRLIVSVKRRGLLSMLSSSWRRQGKMRPGYSSREFFNVLKDGFDVPETISYSTSMIERPGRVLEAIANSIARGSYTTPRRNSGSADFARYSFLYNCGSFLYPWMVVATALDPLMLFIMPGRNIAAKSKRRVWRERRTPILADGRSIAEAALDTKIGSAAPF